MFFFAFSGGAKLLSKALKMVTNNEIKQVRQLHQKKYRIQFGQFIVEGTKLVEELLQSDFNCDDLYFTEEHSSTFAEIANAQFVTNAQMQRMSAMTTSPGILAVVKIPRRNLLDKLKGWTIVLDGVSDPGNLGTILRIADWFGIQQIIAAKDGVDPYSPKVVQASMGAVFRVPLHSADLIGWLSQMREKNTFVCAADMAGENIENVQFPNEGVLVMGSESHGIGEELMPFIEQRITIPGKGKAESLNVAVAMGIICSRLPI